MSERLDRIRASLRDHQCDALALTPGPSLRYVTGCDMHAAERLILVLIPAEGTPVAVLPGLEEHAWAEAVDFDTQCFYWDDADGPAKAVEQAARAVGAPSAIAIEPLVMRVMEHQWLHRLAPGAAPQDGEPILNALRTFKSADEIDAIRAAIAIGEKTLTELLPEMRVGVQERVLAGKLSAGLLTNGGEGISFGPIVLSGPKSALPHGIPDERAIQPGELLLFDFGTSVRGYHCDITRTFVVGAEPDDRTRAIYEAVLEGTTKGRAAAKPGITSGQLHAATQDHLNAAEYDGYFKHRTGHGLGLDIHEPPSIMRGGDAALETGMVFTIEPGLYMEGWGGVRIEDDVLMTQDGAESLTTFPRELQVLNP